MLIHLAVADAPHEELSCSGRVGKDRFAHPSPKVAV
jgi:hypothetical protein